MKFELDKYHRDTSDNELVDDLKRVAKRRTKVSQRLSRNFSQSHN